jgi:hypothetical protein
LSWYLSYQGKQKDYENDKKEDFAVRFASRSKILVIITERNREQG